MWLEAHRLIADAATEEPIAFDITHTFKRDDILG
jgi:hypothetical protein